MSKPLSLWCRYATLGASSRLRFLQFIPALEQAGFQVSCSSFFDNAYLERLYAGRGKSKSAYFSALRRRFGELSQLPERCPMLIEYELLPFLPYWLEKHFIGRRRYILNFDDAVDLRYKKIIFLRDKYPRLIRNAAGIITANSALLERFSQFNVNCFKLPTVPPVSPEFPVPVVPAEKLRIGWIGTPVTYSYLLEHAPVLQKMYELHPFELLAVAGKDLPPVPGIPTLNLPWDEKSEHALLKSCHIGIMPLPDTPFARGKSAFKLIQYLRAGLPSIASAVGENIHVIRQGRTGFAVSDESGWLEAWKFLSSPENRAQMQEEIAFAAGEYGFERNAAELISFINRTFGE